MHKYEPKTIKAFKYLIFNLKYSFFSVSDIHRTWAWWALNDKNINSARKHAFLALKNNIIMSENWKVFYCSLRGY